VYLISSWDSSDFRFTAERFGPEVGRECSAVNLKKERGLDARRIDLDKGALYVA